MIGKKNIVFGFFYLVLTAALGPVMIVNYSGAVATAQAQKQEKVGSLQQAAANDYLNSATLETMTPAEIAKQDAAAILSISAVMNAQAPIDAIKGGPHTHGNLESILNILVGFLLCFVVVARWLKQALSWIFILGALGHSGLLYLAVGLQLPWAGSLLAGPVGYIGPSLILIGLFLAGVVAVMGFKGRLAED
jgi:hypothetical protein